jgi:hypothetical protein
MPSNPSISSAQEPLHNAHAFQQGGTKYRHCQDRFGIVIESHIVEHLVVGMCQQPINKTGTSIATQVGTLQNYVKVWFNPNAIANILSLARVKEKCSVRYDRDEGNQFVVVQPHKQIVFQQSGLGLYYHDTTYRAMVMVNTVGHNREGFTNRAYNKAKQAQRAI